MDPTSLPLVTERPAAGDRSESSGAGLAKDGSLTLDELRERVSARGRSVAAAVGALGDEIRTATDWRTQAARHPFWSVGAAAALGLVFASLFRRRKEPRARILAAAAGGLEGLAGRLRGSSTGTPFREPMWGAGPLMRGVVSALAVQMLRHRLRRHLEKMGVRGLPGPSGKARESFVDVAASSPR